MAAPGQVPPGLLLQLPTLGIPGLTLQHLIPTASLGTGQLLGAVTPGALGAPLQLVPAGLGSLMPGLGLAPALPAIGAPAATEQAPAAPEVPAAAEAAATAPAPDASAALSAFAPGLFAPGALTLGSIASLQALAAPQAGLLELHAALYRQAFTAAAAAFLLDPAAAATAAAATVNATSGGLAEKGSRSRPGDWSCPSCGDLQFARNETCRRCGTQRSEEDALAAKAALEALALTMRPGDWICSRCNDHVFARHESCRRCSTPKPPNVEPAPLRVQVARDGDWNCRVCGDLQFGRNIVCRRCGADRPLDAGLTAAVPTLPSRELVGREPLRPGDWICPRCNDHVFSRHDACRRCATPRPLTVDISSVPVREPKAGDWTCRQCKDLQFARNQVCRRCGAARPPIERRFRSRSPVR